MSTKQNKERKEALMRLFIAIVAGIIIELWGILIQAIALFNWINTLVSGQRNKWMAEFCETWNTQKYVYIRYLTSQSNERPFPFADTTKSLSRFE